MSEPYTASKSSGVDWLGQIPTHWNVAQSRRYFGERKTRALPDDRQMTASQKYGVIFQEDFARLEGVKVMQVVTGAEILKHVEPNDFIISMRSFQGGIEWCRDRGCVSSAYVPLYAKKELDFRFFHYLFKSTIYIQALQSTTNLVRDGQALRYENFTKIRLPIPSVPEQKTIAAFLDRETGKIDALVEEQRRLIALLKEKRHAVISHAVTKGLDPTAPMKPSGIDWLGDIPAHWEVTPLKHLTAPGRDIMYGIVLPGPSVEDGVPIVKGGDVKEHRLQVGLLNRTTIEIEAPFARARLKPMDIVYSIRGTIGDAELVPTELENANITQDVARVSPRAGINNFWLLYALRSKPIFVQLEQRSLGAAVRGINIYDLKRARIPFPPEKEQTEIAEFVTKATKQLEDLITEAGAAIRLLRERRSALISAAVTGKIDVRGFVPEMTEAA